MVIIVYNVLSACWCKSMGSPQHSRHCKLSERRLGQTLSVRPLCCCISPTLSYPYTGKRIHKGVGREVEMMKMMINGGGAEEQRGEGGGIDGGPQEYQRRIIKQ